MVAAEAAAPRRSRAVRAAQSASAFTTSSGAGEAQRKLLEPSGKMAPNTRVLVTVHPSYLLRVPPETREAEYAEFVDDLKIAADYLRDRR